MALRTLYTVQTKVYEIHEIVVGGEVKTYTYWNDPEPKSLFAGAAYKLSESDEKLMYTKVNRPQFKGSFQIMIFGSGNGMYDDNTGSKPNPDATTVVVDMNEWNDVFEPILLGQDVKSPIGMEKPGIGEIVSEGFEQTVDKYKDAVPPAILPAGEVRPPSTIVCSMCGGKPHPESVPAYRTGQYGEVTDTIRKNDKTDKIDTIPTKSKN